MSRQITITLPDGYEETEHLILVAPDETSATIKYVYVLSVDTDGKTEQVEEIGGGPLSKGLTHAAQAIRAPRLTFTRR